MTGSKNKKRAAEDANSPPPAPKRRGRPPGSKNKPKPHNPPPRVRHSPVSYPVVASRKVVHVAMGLPAWQQEHSQAENPTAQRESITMSPVEPVGCTARHDGTRPPPGDRTRSTVYSSERIRCWHSEANRTCHHLQHDAAQQHMPSVLCSCALASITIAACMAPRQLFRMLCQGPSAGHEGCLSWCRGGLFFCDASWFAHVQAAAAPATEAAA